MCRCRIWGGQGLIHRAATTSFETCLQRISGILLAAIAEPNASHGELGQLHPAPYRSCLVERGKVEGRGSNAVSAWVAPEEFSAISIASDARTRHRGGEIAATKALLLGKQTRTSK